MAWMLFSLQFTLAYVDLMYRKAAKYGYHENKDDSYV